MLLQLVLEAEVTALRRDRQKWTANEAAMESIQRLRARETMKAWVVARGREAPAFSVAAAEAHLAAWA